MKQISLSGVRVERETEKAVFLKYRSSVSKSRALYSNVTELNGWAPKSQVDIQYWEDKEYEDYYGRTPQEAKELYGNIADIALPFWLFKKMANKLIED